MPTMTTGEEVPFPASWAVSVRERLDQLARGELSVAVPRHAATVVLLRDTPAGPAAFLLRRVATMAFAAGMHVFPGGSVEPADVGWLGELPAAWETALGATSDLARALVGAAVRETWEECGVSLAAGGQPLHGGVTGVAIDTGLLRPWAHWLTPEAEPRRFDTRFFVAALPTGQQACRGDGESDDARWQPIRAAATLPMLPPTTRTLAELASYPDVAAVLAAPRSVERVMPRFRVHAGHPGVELLMPGQPGYDEAAPPGVRDGG